jgi:hypothetical protein
VANDKKESEILAEQLELLRKANKEAYDQVEKVYAQQELYGEQLKANIITQEQYNKQIEESSKNLSEEGKELVKVIAQKKKLAEAEQDVAAAQAAAVKTLGVLTSGYQKLLSTTEAFTGVNVSMLGSLTSIGQSAKEFAMALDEQEVGLRRSTGFANRYTKTFRSLGKEFRKSGLGIEDLSKSITALSTDFAGFDALEKGTRDGLVSLSKEAKNLGMDFGDFASTIDQLSYSYGFMGSSAISAFNQVTDIAHKTGQSVAKVGSDLVSLGPDLARFGDQGIKVFENLSMKARQLGLGVKQAFDVSELFDTFESAANVAGRLNAQLGLQLNSVKLMKANSDERLDILRQEFKLKGLDFKTSGRRQKQMIASILGVDVDTAGRLLGGGQDISQFQKEEKITQKQVISTQQLATAKTEELKDAIVKYLGGSDGLNAKIKGLIGAMNADSMVTGGVGASSGLALGGALTGIAGMATAMKFRSARLAGFGLKDVSMPKMLGNMFQKGGKTPTSTPKPTAGNRQQRRAREAIERRQGKRGSRPSAPKPPAGSGATKGLTKGLFGAGANAGLKAFGRAIPFVGMGIGIMGAFDRIGRGDYKGAMGELGVGALSFIPGIGGLAASVGGSIALSARDSAKSAREMNQRSMNTPGGTGTGSPNELIIKELVVHSVVELDGIQIGEAITKEFKKQAELIRSIVEKPLQPTQ